MAEATTKRLEDGGVEHLIDFGGVGGGGPRIKVAVLDGGGSISTIGMKDTDEPTEDDWDGDLDDFDAAYESWSQYNAAIDGIESLILAAACEGVDITSAAFVEAIQTAIDAVANAFPA